MGGPAAGPLEAELWGTPSSSISPLGSARRRVWAQGPFFMYPLLLSFSLSPRLFVTEWRPGCGRGCRGAWVAKAQPCLLVSVPYPG